MLPLVQGMTRIRHPLFELGYGPSVGERLSACFRLSGGIRSEIVERTEFTLQILPELFGLRAFNSKELECAA